MRFIYIISAIILFTSACTEDRYFEENIDFTDRSWNMQDSVLFQFEIDSIELPYRVKLNLRNTMDYPYRNIYVQYYLKDSSEILNENLQNIKLFEAKTGKPFGDRQSEIYSHQLLIQDSVYFPKKGKYTIQLEQYMREKELEGIVSAGIKIEQLK
ncbi:gliding motility lipoprotein GldH [Marivirga arenosa]|uniref:Gliding motility lipoprotein GldH n=2 Tax=Marivirga arenosa TaxID=3059076 RepID=A0AA52EVF4_9BACT|nr:gliding motility lipoprotein GldH [Marivirga sp. BKB1-2]WNB17375.1 gliding motility lipoprotein GldH [Marivirga sp. BKB1-2]